MSNVIFKTHNIYETGSNIHFLFVSRLTKIRQEMNGGVYSKCSRCSGLFYIVVAT